MDMRAPCAGPWSGASPGGHHGGADQPVRSFRWRNLAHHVPQGAVMTFTAVPLTLYPDMFPGPLGHSMAGRALESGTWACAPVQIRDFAPDKHRTVDDTPAGGGTSAERREGKGGV